MRKIKNIRGMHDIFGDSFSHHQSVINRFNKLMEEHNYLPFSTPIMEYSNVFTKSLGDSSDVVTKEMYTFNDKSNESVTLRPEGTAGIARAIISNGLIQDLPLKLYYNGPMFRYERKKKGRMRQFHQIGIENYSNENFYADVEVIYIAYLLLNRLKVLDKVSLKINTLGDPESRKNYISSLVNYFFEKKSKLSEDSIIRLEKNPLRILDSKHLQDIELVKNAPKIYDYLSSESRDYYEGLKLMLNQLNINYKEDPLLVRGLDYYSHTAFEFTLNEKENYAILAGGKYESLVESLGGPKISGTGWAAGIERLMSLCTDDSKKRKLILVIPLSQKCLSLSYRIRNESLGEDFKYEISTNFNLKKSLKYSNKINASYAVIIGENEVENDYLTIKNLKDGEQKSIKNTELKDYLSNE